MVLITSFVGFGRGFCHGFVRISCKLKGKVADTDHIKTFISNFTWFASWVWSRICSRTLVFQLLPISFVKWNKSLIKSKRQHLEQYCDSYSYN